MPKQFSEGNWDIDLFSVKNELTICVYSELNTENPICLISPLEKLNFEDKMNANLIAHAPQMYDALDKLRDSSDEIKTLLDKIDDIPEALNFDL